MSALMKPSDYLKSNGWKPTQPKLSPRKAMWIDPTDKKEYDFITAILIQGKRDEKPE